MKYLAVHFNDSELSDNEILIDKNVVLVDDDSIVQLDEFETGCNVAILKEMNYSAIDYPIIIHEHIFDIIEYYISGKGFYKNYIVIDSDGESHSYSILGEIKFYKNK